MCWEEHRGVGLGNSIGGFSCVCKICFLNWVVGI